MKTDLKKVPLDMLAEELLERGGKMGQMNFSQFIMTVATTPILAIELIIKDSMENFLLTYRDDSDFKGWHFPGSLIHPFESLEETCRRTAKEEVGVRIKNIYLGIGISNYNNPETDKRHYKNKAYPTHFIGIVCMADVIQEQIPKDGRFFYKRPKNLIECHKKLFRIGRSFLKNYQTGLVLEEKE